MGLQAGTASCSGTQLLARSAASQPEQRCSACVLASHDAALPRPARTPATAANRTVSFTQLSYRDTDVSAGGPNFHPLIQQKRLATGQAKDDFPQVVRLLGAQKWGAGCRAHVSCLPPPPHTPPQLLQYRGLPFRARTHGILNATGLNERIVQVGPRGAAAHRG